MRFTSLFRLAQRATAARLPSSLLCSGVIFANRLAPEKLNRLDRAKRPRMLRISASVNISSQCGHLIGCTSVICNKVAAQQPNSRSAFAVLGTADRKSWMTILMRNGFSHGSRKAQPRRASRRPVQPLAASVLSAGFATPSSPVAGCRKRRIQRGSAQVDSPPGPAPNSPSSRRRLLLRYARRVLIRSEASPPRSS